MIIITGTISLDPAKRDEAIKLGCEHSTRSRAEDGCISHNCYIDAEDANRMHFFEQWRDMDAVKAHFAVPESGAFVGEISELASGPPAISIFEAKPIDGAPF
ncbi:putative quinol monooxygenase [Altererythrobacter sp.]|uniref:putative quinol monooxygenase n=1 Tax=Altererythrobacter sp. TaxID=1872480 RepID=UPI001B16C3DA|nr:putative quinol monooxygenase [Altererythrobacter sp.]MBO6945948.1 antibiotic biosynthesis monooxygenase [Altererythrobacter sp.]